MKNIKLIFSFVLLLAVTISCSIPDGIDQDLSSLNSIVSPTNVAGLISITNDNTSPMKSYRSPSYNYTISTRKSIIPSPNFSPNTTSNTTSNTDVSTNNDSDNSNYVISEREINNIDDSVLLLSQSDFMQLLVDFKLIPTDLK